MTSPALAAVRGRPSIAGLTESLGKARSVNVTLREELRAHLRESAAFAEDVRAHANRVWLATTGERPDLAAHEAAAIVMAADAMMDAADRRLRQTR